MPAQNLPGLILDRANPLARGLVGWWPLNEGGGSGVADVTGTGKPSPFATGTNLPKWVGFVRGGSALEFDGVDDTVTPVSKYSFNIGAEDFGMSVWYRTTGVGTYIAMANYSAGANWWFGIQTGLITFSNNGPQIQTATTSNDGRWHHAVATRASGVVSVYVDGALGVSGSLAGTTNPNGTFYLGAFVIPGSYPWPGGMAHARFYSRALSAREVAQLYADPLAGALASVRASRLIVPAVVSPPAAIAAPPTADRLWNRGYVGRIFRRGEKG